MNFATNLLSIVIDILESFSNYLMRSNDPEAVELIKALSGLVEACDKCLSHCQEINENPNKHSYITLQIARVILNNLIVPSQIVEPLTKALEYAKGHSTRTL